MEWRAGKIEVGDYVSAKTLPIDTMCLVVYQNENALWVRDGDEKRVDYHDLTGAWRRGHPIEPSEDRLFDDFDRKPGGGYH